MGTKQRFTNDNSQLNMKPITRHETIRLIDSIRVPSCIPVTVSRAETSVARRAVRIPGLFSTRSNQPIS